MNAPRRVRADLKRRSLTWTQLNEQAVDWGSFQGGNEAGQGNIRLGIGYVVLRATAHMVMDDSRLCTNKDSSSGATGTAGGETVRAKSDWTYEFDLSDGKEQSK